MHYFDDWELNKYTLSLANARTNYYVAHQIDIITLLYKSMAVSMSGTCANTMYKQN